MLFFDSTVSALEAARQGLGVTLGIFPLVCRYPGFGSEIVRVTDLEFRHRDNYKMVCAESAHEQPKIVAFKNWLYQTLEAM